MSQSRRASAAETAVNTVLGCVINWSWLVFVFPVLVRSLGIADAATVTTVVMIGVSSVRQYLVRRAFERWG